MKYLIPIEIPNEMGDKIKAFYVTISNGFQQRDIRVDCDLIPMPMKKKCNMIWYSADREIKTLEFTEHDKGWNECVDYLEGEDNE